MSTLDAPAPRRGQATRAVTTPIRGPGGLNLVGLAFPVVLLVSLELIARATGYVGESVALPSAILARLGAGLADGSVLHLTSETLSSAFGGLLIGSAIGLFLGILFGVFPPAFAALELTTEVIRPIPSVSLIPVALLVFGFGYVMEISLIAKSSIWAVMIMTHAAIAGVKPRLTEVSRLLELGVLDRVTKIVLPSIVPSIFVGFRLSMGVALLVSITIEIAVNPRGLGYAMMRAEETLQMDLMFALLFWVGFVGWALNAVLLALQHALFARFNVAGRAR